MGGTSMPLNFSSCLLVYRINTKAKADAHLMHIRCHASVVSASAQAMNLTTFGPFLTGSKSRLRRVSLLTRAMHLGRRQEIVLNTARALLAGWPAAASPPAVRHLAQTVHWRRLSAHRAPHKAGFHLLGLFVRVSSPATLPHNNFPRVPRTSATHPAQLLPRNNSSSSQR